MTSPVEFLEFDGTLTQAAEMRQVICDTQGHLRPAVCMDLRTNQGNGHIRARQFFNDPLQAQAHAKTLKKGMHITVRMPVVSITLSGNAEQSTVHAPAPGTESPPTPTSQSAAEPELQF